MCFSSPFSIINNQRLSLAFPCVVGCSYTSGMLWRNPAVNHFTDIPFFSSTCRERLEEKKTHACSSSAVVCSTASPFSESRTETHACLQSFSEENILREFGICSCHHANYLQRISLLNTNKKYKCPFYSTK